MAAFYEVGKYKVKITNQFLAENKKGNPEVQLIIKPLGYYKRENGQESYTEQEGQYERTIYLVFTQATIGDEKKPGWVIETLRFLGFKGESFSTLDPESKEFQSLIGQEIDCLCAHEDFKSKTNEKWSVYRGNGQRQPVKAPEKRVMKGLDAKFGKVLKATAKSARELVPAGVGELPERPADQPESDIPF